MFFKGSPPALKETNRSPEATCMEGINNHALTPTIFVLVRPSTHPDPCDTAANKKRKIPPRLSRDPTPDGAPPPNGPPPSRPRRRSSLAGGGGAPSSPATAALLPRRWRSLSRRPPISSEALRARPWRGQMHGHDEPWLHRVGARTAARQVPSSPNPHLFFLHWMLDV